MSRKIPEHGTANRYAYGCRCAPCTKAATRADAKRTLDRLEGRPHSVPAGPTVAHLRALTDRGLTSWQIAREADMEPSTVRRLIAGEQKTVWARTAKKALSVPLDVRPSMGDVPAVGAVRRVRALYALGHFNYEIADAAGVSRDAISALASGKWPTIKVDADDGIRAAYDKLSMLTGTSWKTRKLAERNGWAPPLAWDDEAIDDPDATPQTDAQEPAQSEGPNLVDRWLMGEAVILPAADRDAVLLYLFEWSTLDAADIAERLEMTKAAALQVWSRHKRKCRAEGKPVPWRRRWVAPMPLTKNDVGEAA